MSRARKECKKSAFPLLRKNTMNISKKLPTAFSVGFSIFFIYNRCTFYSCPSIFCFACPSPKTYPPNSPARCFRRSRGILLRLNSFLPARQTAFRTFRICIEARAFSLPSVRFLSPIILSFYPFDKRFATYKIALPLKNPSKKPCTSKPDLSNAAIKSCGFATEYKLSA